MKKTIIKSGFIIIAMMFAFITGCNKSDEIQNENSIVQPNSPTLDGKPGPSVPSNLEVPAGNVLISRMYASGFQIYRCNGTSWAFVAPEATLYSDARFSVITGTHFGGPRWKSNSGSIVRGALDSSAASPDPNAIPWLLLRSVESSGPGIFDGVTYIQRVNTTGGKTPTTGCDPSKIGQEIRVPYTAEYYFYRAQ